MTHLNDLSKAYLEQIAEKKKDDTYLEPDMKKRQANNEKARKDMKKMGSMSNPHFGSGPTGSMSSEALDPVGKEDGDVNNDGKKDSSDSYLMKRRKAIAKAMKKESFVTSDWRHEISEVMNDIESEPIKEKKVKNKVTINPTMGEAVEEIGGTLIEEIEVDDIEGVIECVYGELIEEGYTEDEVESAIEQALTEAEVTMGHDSYGPQKTEPKAERTRDKLKKKAKGFLGKVAVKAYNKAREAKVAATPAVQRAKTSAKRGIRKMAQKVVDRMSEEVIDEAVYGYGSAKKPAPTDKRLTVTNADKAGNTPAYQKYKAGDKNYKAADHMKEGIRDVDPKKGTAERKARLEKKRGMKMDDHPQYQKEGYGAPGHNPGSGEKSVARAKALMDKQGRKGAPGLDAMAAAKKEHEARRGVKKEEKDPFGRPGGKHGGVPKKGGGYDKAYQANMKKVKELEQKEEVEVAEADSLAAMQARREKRLAAQRKREGTTASGRDFGHDYSLSDKQQKARRDAEFKAGIGTKKEEVEVDEAMSSYDRNRKRAAQRAADRNAARAAGKTGAVPGVGYVSPRKERETYVDSAGTTRHKSGAKMEEVEVDEAMMAGPRKDAMKKKEHSAKSGSDRAIAFNIGTRRDVSTSDPTIKSRGGRADKRTGEGDRGMGNAAKRRMEEEASMSPQEVALQKRKAMLDKMIATKRMQGLKKTTANKEEPAKAIGEEASDAMKDRRMERGGVAGNVDYRKSPATPNLAGKKKPYDGMSALEKVKASIRAKHGQGAIMDTKKK